MKQEKRIEKIACAISEMVFELQEMNRKGLGIELTDLTKESFALMSLDGRSLVDLASKIYE
jgi:hypothetical protein